MGVFSASRRHLAVARGVEDDGKQSIFNLHPQCSNSQEFMESLQVHLPTSTVSQENRVFC